MSLKVDQTDESALLEQLICAFLKPQQEFKEIFSRCFDVQEEIFYKEDLARTIPFCAFQTIYQGQLRPSLKYCAFLRLSETAEIVYTLGYYPIKTSI